MIVKINELKKRCLQDDNDLLNGKRYHFIDNGGSVLAVAHVDVAPPILHKRDIFYVKGDRIYSPSLDDRLGVYLLLDLLPSMGLKFDVLLTTDEEIGQSTASEFLPDKEYNWIFQFDRRGIDVVMYDYETADHRKLLESFGFIVGRGSFSDICYLEHMGITGFNFGTGYHDEHSINCHMVIQETEFMIANFIKFYHANCDTLLPYDRKIYDDNHTIDDLYYVEQDFINICDYCECEGGITYDILIDAYLCEYCIHILDL